MDPVDIAVKILERLWLAYTPKGAPH